MKHEAKIVRIEHVEEGISVISRCCEHREMPTTINNLHDLSDERFDEIIRQHHAFLEQQHQAFLRGEELRKKYGHPGS